MEMTKAAMDYLYKDPLLHMGMIEPIRLGHAQIIEATEHGVLMLEERSNIYMISADSREYGCRLLESIPHARTFMACQRYVAEEVEKRIDVAEKMNCFQAVYRKKTPIEYEKTLEIAAPGEKEFQEIKENYHLVSEEELGKLYQLGNLYCAFYQGKMAGFIGCHLEGSMGLLEIFPEYRRKGMAMELESFLINELMKCGRVPFCQVVLGNEASLALQRKLGLEITESCIYWLFG